MYEYRETLKEHGVIQSMSRKGNCLDDSPMENFFGIMKREMFYGHEWEFKTQEQLKDAIIDYINYYNYERISCKLKGPSPINFRQQSINSPIIQLNLSNKVDSLHYRSIFSNAVIVDKEHVYFVIGNSNIKLPLKPKLLFKSVVEYKVRLTKFAICFGILILK